MLSDQLPIREFVELVEVADALGYSELWYTDERFQRDCYAGLTLAARHSRSLRLGPGVNDPYSRHPGTIAMSIATLDEISGGRALLGLGVGGPSITKQLHLTMDRPVRALREAIEIIRLLLSGEPVHYQGEIFKLDGQLGAQPVQKYIPIYVASHSPQVLRLCGRLADGVLLANMVHPTGIGEAISVIREGERSADRMPGATRVALRLEACISNDRANALDAMRVRVADRMLVSYPKWGYLEQLGVEITPAMREAAESRDRQALTARISDDQVRGSVLAGTADDVAQQLRAVMTPDIAQVTIRPYPCAGQGLTPTVRAFAERVWPQVSASRA